MDIFEAIFFSLSSFIFFSIKSQLIIVCLQYSITVYFWTVAIANLFIERISLQVSLTYFTLRVKRSTKISSNSTIKNRREKGWTGHIDVGRN